MSNLNYKLLTPYGIKEGDSKEVMLDKLEENLKPKVSEENYQKVVNYINDNYKSESDQAVDDLLEFIDNKEKVSKPVNKNININEVVDSIKDNNILKFAFLGLAIIQFVYIYSFNKEMNIAYISGFSEISGGKITILLLFSAVSIGLYYYSLKENIINKKHLNSLSFVGMSIISVLVALLLYGESKKLVIFLISLNFILGLITLVLTVLDAFLNKNYVILTEGLSTTNFSKEEDFKEEVSKEEKVSIDQKNNLNKTDKADDKEISQEDIDTLVKIIEDIS